MYLFDTDHIEVIGSQTQPEYGRLSLRVSSHPLTVFYYSVVSLHEQSLGANAYINRAKDVAGVLRGYEYFGTLLAEYCRMQVLPYDAAAAAEFGSLRIGKVRIGAMDLRIASIALSRGFTVLTRNLRDFTQVPGLKVEDWTI